MCIKCGSKTEVFYLFPTPNFLLSFISSHVAGLLFFLPLLTTPFQVLLSFIYFYSKLFYLFNTSNPTLVKTSNMQFSSKIALSLSFVLAMVSNSSAAPISEEKRESISFNPYDLPKELHGGFKGGDLHLRVSVYFILELSTSLVLT